MLCTGPMRGPPHPGTQESCPSFTPTSLERSAGAEEAPGCPRTRDPSQFTPNETRVAGFAVLWLRTSCRVLLEAYDITSRLRIGLSGLPGPVSPCLPPRSWDGLYAPHTRRCLCVSSATFPAAAQTHRQPRGGQHPPYADPSSTLFLAPYSQREPLSSALGATIHVPWDVIPVKPAYSALCV